MTALRPGDVVRFASDVQRGLMDFLGVVIGPDNERALVEPDIDPEFRVRWFQSVESTWFEGELDRVGITIATQQEADERIPELLRTPGERVLRCTPSGLIDLGEWLERIDHCYCGAESPPHKEDICPACDAEGTTISTTGWAQAERYRTGERYDDESEAGRADVDGTHPTLSRVIVEGGDEPMDPDHVRKLRDDCESAGVLFELASWGAWKPRVLLDPDDYDESTMHVWRAEQGSDGWANASALVSERVGRENSGRLLDGVTHDGLEVTP